MTRIHLCDYGVGNIHNVHRALVHAGAEVVHCTSGDELSEAAALVIPGVGAFGDCIQRFRAAGFEAPIRRAAVAGLPLLGICVGMQMLAQESDEYGSHAGLGLIAGRVSRLPETDPEGAALKLPHIAWSRLAPGPGGWAGSPLAAITDGTYAYFVHSYAVICDDPGQVLATCRYGGHEIVAAVRIGQVFGTQFHPEKSGEAGLAILRQFVAMAGEFAASGQALQRSGT